MSPRDFFALALPARGADRPAGEGRGTHPLRHRVARLRSSKFARDAFALLALNLLSKAVGFFASTWAARSLGPFNLGVSALVLSTVQQVGLVGHGGLETVATRKIAEDPSVAESTTATVLTFRMAVAAAASVIWLCIVLVLPGLEHRGAWLLGVPLILLGACNIGFLFSGLERLPVQNAIGTGGTLLTALLYFAFFRPGMPAGADLVVATATGIAVTGFSWAAYARHFKRWPLHVAGLGRIKAALRVSWRYWLMAVVSYLYSSFQVPLVAYILGAREAGLYRAGFMMAAAVELLFGSINSLLLPRLIAWRKMGAVALWRRQHRLLLMFCGIGLPPVLLLAIASPWFFDLFLGAEFARAVSVFRILVIGRLVVFLGQIYAYGLAALGEDNGFLFASTLGAVAGVLLSPLAALKFGITAVAASSVVAELLVVSSCYFLMRAAVQRDSPDPTS